jgi:hypothetical protein
LKNDNKSLGKAENDWEKFLKAGKRGEKFNKAKSS